MHACNKTIEKSKEMIIIKVKIMVISKRRERVMLRKVTRGAFEVLAMFHFLTWLITWKF